MSLMQSTARLLDPVHLEGIESLIPQHASQPLATAWLDAQVGMLSLHELICRAAFLDGLTIASVQPDDRGIAFARLRIDHPSLAMTPSLGTGPVGRRKVHALDLLESRFLGGIQTPDSAERLHDLAMNVIEGRVRGIGFPETRDGVSIGGRARLHPESACIGPAGIGEAVRIARGARILPGAFVSRGCSIGAQAVVGTAMVLPFTRVHAGERLMNVLRTPEGDLPFTGKRVITLAPTGAA